ncbi:MAG: HAMP domain-containing sensor histidine kinase [Clostridium sp.]
MIYTLRRKFIAAAMASLFIVLTILIATINISNFQNINENSDAILNILMENGGIFPLKKKNPAGFKPIPPEMSPEVPFSTRYFSAITNKDGKVIALNTENIASVSTTMAEELASHAYSKGKTSGFIDIYKYGKLDTDNGSLLIFIDCKRDLDTFYSFLFNSILVGFTGMLLVFILVLILSKGIVKPIAESYEKQKRFITDAGHELKTPLTIIDANIENLELEKGENQWTKSIRNQVKRLSSLTSDLVTLSRMDEENKKQLITDFSLSDAISEASEPFSVIAENQHKTFNIDIEKNLSFKGNEQSLRQLVSILLENAMKYSDESGKIKLVLKRQGRKIILSLYNSTESIEKGNLDMLFERFYRSDVSRNSSTGGYGIGLSIAKAIVTAHKGTITASSLGGKFLMITVKL